MDVGGAKFSSLLKPLNTDWVAHLDFDVEYEDPDDEASAFADDAEDEEELAVLEAPELAIELNAASELF